MKVEKIDHVAILVKDLEEAGKLFADLFGLEFSGPGEHKDLDVRNLTSSEGVDLITPLTPDGAMARTLNNRGEGFQLLSLRVANVAEATAEMKAKGIRQVGGSGTTLALFHPKDLHNVLIQLIEH